MCNLYRLKGAAQEIAELFGATAEQGVNHAAEVYPGYPGLVVAEGRLRGMTWGFPLAQIGRQGRPIKAKPVNNAREDKLTTPFWRDSFMRRRCLIPLSAWAEAEGPRGRMTRTWYALPGDAPFAVAGVWRPTAEWGASYSMVMVDGCPAMAADHDRMPLILPRAAWEQWYGGPPEAALALCRPWSGELAVDRTAEPWATRTSPPAYQASLF